MSATIPSLPAPGASPVGLGSGFRPDLSSGTGNYTIPFELPTAQVGFRPDLSLVYSSGAGQDAFGQGWRLNGLIQIGRSTRRGPPDPSGARAAPFALNDGDDLVLIGPSADGSEIFRPRTNIAGWRIERGGDGWVVTTQDGTRYLCGTSANSRIAAPDGGEVMAWLLAAIETPTGQRADLTYLETGPGRQIARIAYPPFAVEFEYEARPDIFRLARYGFPIEQRLRGRFIRIVSNRAPDPILRTYRFTYDQSIDTGVSRLAEVVLAAGAEAFPGLAFGYSDWSRGGVELRRIIFEGEAPPSPGAPQASLVDLDGRGLPGILEGSAAAGWRFWRNKGNGVLAAPQVPGSVPVGVSLDSGEIALLDLEGNGTADLMRISSAASGFYPNAATGVFEGFVPYAAPPPVSSVDPDVRFFDMDGDGIVDAMRATADEFLIYRNRGRDGWDGAPAHRVPRIHDRARFPDVDLAGADIYLADMTGDGLQDIVQIREGEVAYWPYYGHGRWGGQVVMQRRPQFPAGFANDKVRLLDVDGDGLGDLVYIDGATVHVWRNRQGREWSDPIDAPLPAIFIDDIAVVDLFGTGRPAMVLHGSDPAGGVEPAMHALTFSDSAMPNLLTEVRSTLGHVTRIAYGVSTEDMLADEAEGRPWSTFAPFPVQICRSVENHDVAADLRQQRGYRYRDGHYCGIEREFCGFADVGEHHAATEAAPARQVRTRFHIGADPAVSERDRRARPYAERMAQRALRGTPLETETWGEAAGAAERLQHIRSEWSTRVEASIGDEVVVRPFAISVVQDDLGPPGQSNRQVVLHEPPDAHGNPVAATTIGGALDEHGTFHPEMRRRERTLYADDSRAEGGAWMPGRPSARIVSDGAGRPLSAERWLYDGEDAAALPFGTVRRGLVRRHEELVYADGVDDPGPDPAARGFFRVDGSEVPPGWYRCREHKTYSAAGNVAAIRDPFGNAAAIAYDEMEIDPVEVVDAAGHVTRTEYDRQTERPRRILQASGVVEARDYDALGRVTATYRSQGDGTLALATVARFEPARFDTAGALVEPPSLTTFVCRRPGLTPADFAAPPLETSASSYVMRRFYGASGLELMTVASTMPDDAGRVRMLRSAYAFRDAAGRLSAEGKPMFAEDFSWARPPAAGGRAYDLSFDGRGGVRRIDTPDGWRTIDASPRRVSSHDPRATARGGPPSLVQHFNGFGLVSRTEERIDDATVAVKLFAYADDGMLVHVGDEDGATLVSYRYDRTGKRTAMDHRDAGASTFHYDALGRLALAIDPLGQTTRHGYDAIGRMIEVVGQDAGGTEIGRKRFHYDAAPDGASTSPAQLCAVEENGARTVFHHDRAGRLTRKTRTDADGTELSFRYAYDFLGNLVTLTYPNGRDVAYRYGPAGEIVAINGILDSVRYSARGRPEAIAYANGIVARFEYSAAERLSELVVAGGSGPIFAESLRYDANGNVAMATEHFADQPGRTLSYVYDGANRVAATEIAGAGGSESLDLRYDADGNVRVIAEHGLDSIAYDAAKPNRIASLRPGTERRYDAAGRTVSTETLAALEYDVFNRLRRIEHRDGRIAEFDFDYVGRRMRRTLRDSTAIGVIHVMDDLFESGPEGTKLIVRGPTGVAAVVSRRDGKEEVAFCHTDHLGSIRCRTDRVGALVERTSYSTFGRPASNVSNTLFTGKFGDDEMGVIQLGDRFFEPLTGRFLTPDPLILERPEAAGTLPNYLNPYSYAANNPIRNVDPHGRLAFLAVVLIGVAVGAALGAAAAHENGEDPLRGALVGGLVGGLVGAAGLLTPALIGAGMGAVTARGENLWTGAAIGFAFGAIGGAVGQWLPVIPGDSWGAIAGNFVIEVAADGLVMGLSAGTHAMATGGDFLASFKSGFVSGAILAGVKIAVFGVRFRSSTAEADVTTNTQAEFMRQNAHDNYGPWSEATKKAGMPDIASVTVRRGGLLTATGASHAIGVDTVSLSRSAVNELNVGNYETFAHELRHITQQRVAGLGWVEFIVRWVASDKSLHYTQGPANTTQEPYYR